MRKIFSSLLLVGLVFALANGVFASWCFGTPTTTTTTTTTTPPSNNDQSITGSNGTIVNTINASSNTGSNWIKLGGKITTGDSGTSVNLQNLINTNSLAGNLTGNQSISSSNGSITNNVNASSSTGSNTIGVSGYCWCFSCSLCHNKISTGDAYTGVTITNGININEKTAGNVGSQTISNSNGNLSNTVNASSLTGSNVIYLGGRIYTGDAATAVSVINIINQNSVTGGSN